MDLETKVRRLHGRVGGLQRALTKAERRLGLYRDSLGKLQGILATANMGAELRKELVAVLNRTEEEVKK